MNIKHKISPFLFCLLIAAGVSSPCSAQLFVEQGKVVHVVNPPETVTGEIVVHNTSDKAYPVRAYAEDFVYVPAENGKFDGKKEFYPWGTTDRSLQEWFTFSPQEFYLPAYGSKRVSYIIKTPEGFTGGRYGVLFFEKETDAVEAQTGLSVVVRVGTLFFVESNQQDRSLSVSGFSFQNSFLKGEFKNNGNVVVIPDGIYYTLDSDGLVVNRDTIAKAYLPPGGSSEFGIDFGKADLRPGTYTVIMTFDLGQGEVVVREVDFKLNGLAQYQVLQTRD